MQIISSSRAREHVTIKRLSAVKQDDQKLTVAHLRLQETEMVSAIMHPDDSEKSQSLQDQRRLMSGPVNVAHPSRVRTDTQAHLNPCLSQMHTVGFQDI
ncbi:hypothetical protein DPMN_125084, partial [Dreissena polymorpha]